MSATFFDVSQSPEIYDTATYLACTGYDVGTTCSSIIINLVQKACNVPALTPSSFIEEDKSAKAAAKERQRSRDKGPDMSYFYGNYFKTPFLFYVLNLQKASSSRHSSPFRTPGTMSLARRSRTAMTSLSVTSPSTARSLRLVLATWGLWSVEKLTQVGPIHLPTHLTSQADLRIIVWDDKVEGRKNQNYVELKTRVCNNFSHQSDKDKENYERKQMKYWAQSYLIGCPKIIVGRRSRDGRLMMPVEQLTTMNIPTDVRNSTHIWDSVLCVQTLNAFLECKSSTASWQYRRLTTNRALQPAQGHVWRLAAGQEAQRDDCSPDPSYRRRNGTDTHGRVQAAPLRARSCPSVRSGRQVPDIL